MWSWSPVATWPTGRTPCRRSTTLPSPVGHLRAQQPHEYPVRPASSPLAASCQASPGPPRQKGCRRLRTGAPRSSPHRRRRVSHRARPPRASAGRGCPIGGGGRPSPKRGRRQRNPTRTWYSRAETESPPLRARSTRLRRRNLSGRRTSTSRCGQRPVGVLPQHRPRERRTGCAQRNQGSAPHVRICRPVPHVPPSLSRPHRSLGRRIRPIRVYRSVSAPSLDPTSPRPCARRRCSALDSLPYPSRLQRASLSERVELTDEHHADTPSHNRCPLPTSVTASEIGTALPVGSLGVTPDSRSKSGLSSDA